MKKLYTSAKLLGLMSILSFSQSMNAQIVVDFEDIVLLSDSYWDGSDLSGGYMEDGFLFENTYDVGFSSWEGYAVSNVTDNTTAGWGNQFGSFEGGAYSGSNFGVFYQGFGGAHYIDFGVSADFVGMYVTNSTYAGVSMTNGDGFAKQFGSPNDADGNPDGTNGEDWFLLSIYSTAANGYRYDSMGVYLADFRFANNASDFILNTWQYVDLSVLSPGNKLEFQLTSSDNGDFGMNTPSYFLLDNLIVSSNLSLEEKKKSNLSLYPNPSNDIVNITGEGFDQVVVRDLSGKTVKTFTGSQTQLNITDLVEGMYLFSVYEGNILVDNLKVIKQ